MERNRLEEEIELCISERRFAALRLLLEEENPADIAEFFEELSAERLAVLYRILSKEQAADVFASMSSDRQKLLIDSFSDYELKQVLDGMYSDDTADLIDEMPASVVRRIIANVPPSMRHTVNELLKFPDDSAGGVMTTEYVSLKEHMTVSEALAYIRTVAIDKETIYTAYVIDDKRRLLGIVTAKRLLLASEETLIGDIMQDRVISVPTSADKECVAQMFDKYKFIALPVVDAEDRLVGIITVDDAIDVMQEEAEEDFAKMAAITPTDKTYIKTSVFEIFLKRIPWLLILMLSATFTGWIISSFEAALAASVILTSFIPMLMGTGGNSGSQASVTVIRGLSLGEIDYGDWFRVFFKELRVALLCGIALGVTVFLKLQLFDGMLMQNEEITLTVSFIVAISLAMTVLLAKVIGGMLPILAKRLGFDPAVMASPFITTVVDALSLLVYFSVAQSLILGA